jgi:hypothetical protein
MVSRQSSDKNCKKERLTRETPATILTLLDWISNQMKTANT